MTDPHPTDRLPPLPESDWSESQREAARAIVEGPRGALLAPFVPLLRSPELMGHVQRMGEYLRYRSALGTRLSELAILVTASEWSQPVEWAIHAPIARQQGIAQSTVDAIAEGRVPQDLPDDEAVLVAFCTELHRRRSVGDDTWHAALDRFGEHGVVDLIGLCGYYTLLAMVMNAARTPLPPGAAPGLPPLNDP